ncbi:MAG: hypothetical protein ACOC5L_01280 [Halobacteriota archaeon]
MVLSPHQITALKEVIKTYIARENNSEVEIHATQCLCKDKEGWTPQMCASIDRYDEGLVQGINSGVNYICPKEGAKEMKYAS